MQWRPRMDLQAMHIAYLRGMATDNILTIRSKTFPTEHDVINLSRTLKSWPCFPICGRTHNREVWLRI